MSDVILIPLSNLSLALRKLLETYFVQNKNYKIWTARISTSINQIGLTILPAGMVLTAVSTTWLIWCHNYGWSVTVLLRHSEHCPWHSQLVLSSQVQVSHEHYKTAIPEIAMISENEKVI